MVFKALLLKIPCWSFGRRNEKTYERNRSEPRRLILPEDPSFPSKKLFRFQVCGGERTEAKTPPRKGRVGTYFSLAVVKQY